MEIFLLIVYKKGIDETYNDYRYIFNKVNMFQVNLVLNYHF